MALYFSTMFVPVLVLLWVRFKLLKTKTPLIYPSKYSFLYIFFILVTAIASSLTQLYLHSNEIHSSTYYIYASILILGALSLIAVNYATMCNQAYSITAISRDDFFKAIDAGLVRENITKSEINCKAENFKSIRLEPLGLILHYGHSGFSNQASFRVINAKDTIFSKKLKEHIGSYMLNNQTTNTPKTAKLCLLLATILGVSFISAVVLL